MDRSIRSRVAALERNGGGIGFGFLLVLLVSACAGSRGHAVERRPPTATPEAQGGEQNLSKDEHPSTSEGIVEEIFGVQIKDPYRWLEDAQDPGVQTWMSTRDLSTREYLSQLPGRAALKARLKELLYVDRRSAPDLRGSRYFYTVKPADREKALYYWREGKAGAERVLIDPNALSADGSISVGGVFPSRDGKYAAYLEKVNNADSSTLKLLEVASGRVLAQDQIEGLRYTSPSWTPDGGGFYYTWRPDDPSIDETERTAFAEFRFHKLGTDPKHDVTIHPRTGDASKWLGGGVSYDGRYLFVVIGSGWTKSEVFLRLASDDAGPFLPLTRGLEAQYNVATYGERLFVHTNEGAARYRVFETSFKGLKREHWKEIVPEHESAVLQQVDVVGGRLVLRYLKNAFTELQIRTLDGRLERTIALPAIGTASSLLGNEDQDTAYYAFSSFTYPNEIYEISVKSGAQKLYDREKVPAQPSDFAVEQVWYPSKDGTQVPMFVVSKRGIERNGKLPTLLYGYGGFNNSMLPGFSATLFPWLEAGGVFAMPNLRGGGEFGDDWHRAGMRERKQNVFDDFIAAAEYLIRAGYTAPRHLAISGGSNGGLLVGAAMTQRPELFRAVLCSVPLLDMLRYHKFGLGKAWIPEYGDPEDSADFQILRAYSPYHHVKPGVRYPTLLMLSADTDDRVDPMHARKFVAAIEAASTAEPAALLRIEVNAGHGGADMRSKTVERSADEYAFLFNQLSD
ncbi:MAG: hypothetical protein RJA70_173 [Pseudomonadota bacterium]|jgi:prolyl oligopeptidase